MCFVARLSLLQATAGNDTYSNLSICGRSEIFSVALRDILE